MALRAIVNKREDVLRKKSKTVEVFDEKLWQLLDDMKETLVKSNGYGLAAPQVGVLRRICVIDVGEGYYELINPEIVEKSGTNRDVEGCLSCPGEYGYVTRPDRIVFKAQDRFGKWYEKEVTEMFARCVCHETDHLNGRLFLDIVEEMVEVVED